MVAKEEKITNLGSSESFQETPVIRNLIEEKNIPMKVILVGIDLTVKAQVKGVDPNQQRGFQKRKILEVFPKKMIGDLKKGHFFEITKILLFGTLLRACLEFLKTTFKLKL